MRDFDDGVVEIDEAAEAAQLLAEQLEATQQTLDAMRAQQLARRICEARSRYDYAA
jgi:hypothetical protein